MAALVRDILRRRQEIEAELALATQDQLDEFVCALGGAAADGTEESTLVKQAANLMTKRSFALEDYHVIFSGLPNPGTLCFSNSVAQALACSAPGLAAATKAVDAKGSPPATEGFGDALLADDTWTNRSKRVIYACAVLAAVYGALSNPILTQHACVYIFACRRCNAGSGMDASSQAGCASDFRKACSEELRLAMPRLLPDAGDSTCGRQHAAGELLSKTIEYLGLSVRVNRSFTCDTCMTTSETTAMPFQVMQVTPRFGKNIIDGIRESWSEISQVFKHLAALDSP